MQLKPGTLVKLVLPDNPVMDGLKAKVQELTDWGAHVLTEVGSGEFRALYSEMVPYAQVNGQHQQVKVLAKNQGYTGDLCPICGSSRMRRNGSCLLCEECGGTTGCS